MRRLGVLARGLAALLLLAAIIVGVPLVLAVVAPLHLPDHVPALDEIRIVLLRRDNGTVFLTLMKIVGWGAWALFTLSTLVEAAAHLRGVQAPRLPAIGGLQRPVARLVTAAFLIGLPGLSTAAHAAPPPPAIASVQHEVSGLDTQGFYTPSSRTEGTTQPRTAGPPAIHVVKPGENLWKIAEEELGDGSRFKEIFKASRDLDQPGDRKLTNPRLIHPGDLLALPDADQAAPTPAKPSDQSAPANQAKPDQAKPVPSRPAESARPSAAPVPTVPAPAAEAPQADPAQEAPPIVIEPPSLPTTSPELSSQAPGTEPAAAPTGEHRESSLRAQAEQAFVFSALTSAGLLGLLGLKRLVQRRRRKPGHRIALPEKMSEAERGARLAEKPVEADLLRRGLRTLAKELAAAGGGLPLPASVEVTGRGIELRLVSAVPSSLPTGPFSVVDELTWRLQPERVLPATELAEIADPYPALVGLGMSGTSQVLVDLESTGVIALAGEDVHVREVLTAFAVDLAVSQCSDHLQILCVGFAPELPSALSSGRLRHLDSIEAAVKAVQSHARDVAAELDGLELSHTRHARLTATDLWMLTPLIVLSALPVDPGMQGLLLSLTTGRGGLGAIIAAQPGQASDSDWLLDAAPGQQVKVPVFGRSLLLPRVAAPVLRQLVDDFSTAGNVQSIPDPRWIDIPPEPDDLRAFLTSPAVPRQRPALTLLPSTESVTPAPPSPVRPKPSTGVLVNIPVAIAADPPPTIVLPVVAPRPDPHPADSDTDSDAGQELVEDVYPIDPAAPYLRVLGEVTVDNRDINELKPERRNRPLELAAFLKLHPGRSAEQISHGLGGWTTDTRNTYMSLLRTFFGQDPDGNNYVPSVSSGKLYTLHKAVGCDWDHFTALAHRGLTHIAHGNRPDLGVTDLREALDLVRGRPFASALPGRYVWANFLEQEMLVVIVDVAHALADTLINTGDYAGARAAATKGLHVEPGSELLYRDWFIAEYRAGNRQGLQNAAEKLLRSLQELDLEMEPDTAELLDQLLDSQYRPAQ